jgi:hypothetical protein
MKNAVIAPADDAQNIEGGRRRGGSGCVVYGLSEIGTSVAVDVADGCNGLEPVGIDGRASPNPQILRQRAARDAEQKND